MSEKGQGTKWNLTLEKNLVETQDKKGFLQIWAYKLGFNENKSMVLSLCLMLFCEMETEFVNCFIFPYYQYFKRKYQDIKRFSKAPYINSEDDMNPSPISKAVREKISFLTSYTIKVQPELNKRYNNKCTNICDSKYQGYFNGKAQELKSKRSFFVMSILYFIKDYGILERESPILQKFKKNWGYNSQGNAFSSINIFGIVRFLGKPKLNPEEITSYFDKSLLHDDKELLQKIIESAKERGLTSDLTRSTKKEISRLQEIVKKLEKEKADLRESNEKLEEENTFLKKFLKENIK